MSEQGPFDGAGLPIDPALLARMMASSGPVNWEMAKMVLGSMSGEASNVDPLRRIRLEELLRVAELHVAQATGLATTTTGAPLRAVALTEGAWAERTLDDLQPVLERLAVALTPPSAPAADATDAPADPFSRIFADLPKVMAPMMLGMQSGMLVAQLAGRAFGQYEPPLPRPRSDELAFVPAHIDAFAHDWSLDVDDLSLWVCLSEVAHHSVLGLPHVAARLQHLVLEHVGGFRPDPLDIQERLGQLDPSDPAGLQALLSDPQTLLGAMQTEEQRARLPQLEAIVVAVEGYVDHVLDTAGRALLGSYAPITEALRRRRLEETPSDRFVGHLLGIELGEDQFERGHAFVQGVLERAGEEGLARLWASEETLPTPAEVDAPGLWLARIDL